MLAALHPLLWLLTLAPLAEGDSAPTSLDVVALDGRRASLELRGQVTVVEFFATWCPRSRESVAGYRKLAATYGDRVRFVVVDVEEPARVVMYFFAAHSLPASVLVVRDPDGRTMQAFGPKSYPSSLVIDGNGVVRAVTRGWGETTAEWLGRAIERSLGKESPRAASSKKKRPAPPPSKSADEHARDLGVEVLR
jgi:cytochrome c biogenesis protein CcmG, thiol:disulfide interchange protein DsbE